jgi:ribose 5-phosphate isomerase B
MQQKIIPIGADHAGFTLKETIIKHLESKGHDVKDFGCFSEVSIDYPDYAHPVAEMVENNSGTIGILICGSGNGINMTANKHQGIRSALCWKKEIAELARQHNNANIITLPARFITEEEAIEMVDVFLATEFEGGRHQNRIDKIACQ